MVTQWFVKGVAKSSGATKSNGGTLLCFSIPRPDTGLRCKTTDMWLVPRTVWLFTPQLSLILPQRMARLSWPGSPATYQDGLPTSLIHGILCFRDSLPRGEELQFHGLPEWQLIKFLAEDHIEHGTVDRVLNMICIPFHENKIKCTLSTSAEQC